ncbi:MAG: HAD-IA family hydrolase [Azospirillaceae bacterium]
MTAPAPPRPRGPSDPPAFPAGLGAVLFDLDGTLLDSLPGIAAGANRVLAEHGRSTLPVERVRPMIGDGAAMLMRRAFEATGPAISDSAVEACVARYAALLTEMPMGPDDFYTGALDLLRALADAGIATGVVTNKPPGPTRHALAAAGADALVGTVVTGDGPWGRKPSAGPVLEALSRLGVAPAGAVMVGDHAADVGAARAAGIPVVAVSFGYSRTPAAELGADAVIGDLAELPAALGAIAYREAQAWERNP